VRQFVSIITLAAAGLLAGCAATGDGPGISLGESAVFAANHDFTVPVAEGTKQVRAWFAMPCDRDPAQSTSDWKVECSLATPHTTRIVRDEAGNRFLFLEADAPPTGDFTVKTSFTVERQEVSADLAAATRQHTPEELQELSMHLQSTPQTLIDTQARTMAREATQGESNPVIASRRIYDRVLQFMEYHVKDPKPDAQKTMQATGTGSSVKSFETKCGNCTDFHAVYAAVSRAAGIPCREVYGSFFKGPLDGADKDQSYHCWIEFHAPGIGWIPLDVAVADIFVADFTANENSRPRCELTTANGYQGPDPAMVDYYFGHLEPRRVSWHYYRNLVMKDPRQAGELLLWNPMAYAEADGKSFKVTRKLTYRQLSGPGAATATSAP
jgi:hypothetical protein